MDNYARDHSSNGHGEVAAFSGQSRKLNAEEVLENESWGGHIRFKVLSMCGDDNSFT